MRKIILAVPKGRILEELIPLLKKVKIEPENDFFQKNSRKLMFKTNIRNLFMIRVRSFDVATFVAFGAAHIGVAGDDVLKEFEYKEIYKVLDLRIGKCRLSVAKKKKILIKVLKIIDILRLQQNINRRLLIFLLRKV